MPSLADQDQDSDLNDPSEVQAAREIVREKDARVGYGGRTRPRLSTTARDTLPVPAGQLACLPPAPQSLSGALAATVSLPMREPRVRQAAHLTVLRPKPGESGLNS